MATSCFNGLAAHNTAEQTDLVTTHRRHCKEGSTQYEKSNKVAKTQAAIHGVGWATPTEKAGY